MLPWSLCYGFVLITQPIYQEEAEFLHPGSSFFNTVRFLLGKRDFFFFFHHGERQKGMPCQQPQQMLSGDARIA